MEFSVVSYNIRYAAKEDTKKGYGWKLRRKEFVNQLLSATNHASIYCFQEVLWKQYKYLKKYLFSKHNYDSYHIGRDNGKCKGEGCSIFYNQTLFQCLEKGTFALHHNPKAFGVKAFDAACPRIASYVVLQHISTAKKVLVINTHWDHVGSQAQCESGKLIKQFIDNFWNREDRSRGDFVVVLCGDLNVASVERGVLELTSNEFLKECLPKNPITFTGFDLFFQASIDHIFVKYNGTVQYECDSIMNLYFDEQKKIPLSDHRPLLCLFWITS